jgi:fermentation-respiration switch protein FrsA (DUF1100 family)
VIHRTIAPHAHVDAFLSLPAATMPRFTDDGTLLFLCDAPGSAQVCALAPDGAAVQRTAHRAAEYGDPVADAELLERLSPIHRADRIAAPLLVAQGMTDPRVPPFESEQIVAALKGRGVPVRYVTFPDEGHGFTKRDNRRTIYAEVVAFLAKHLLGEGR